MGTSVRDEFVIIEDSAIRPRVETIGLSFQSFYLVQWF